MPNRKEEIYYVAIKKGDQRWYINEAPFYPPFSMGPFKVSLGNKEQLKMYASEGNISIKMRLYRNGRFTVEIVKDNEQIYYKKRYVKVPINGFINIVPADNLEDYIIFFRDMELQERMNAINVDRVHAKPSKRFFVDKESWRIVDPLITDKMVNPDSFFNVLSNGDIYIKDDGIYIDFNPYGEEDEPLPNNLRWAILTVGNHEGNNNFTKAALYINGGMFTEELCDVILNGKRNASYNGASILNAFDFDVYNNYAKYVEYNIDDNGILTIEKLHAVLPKLKLFFGDDGEIYYRANVLLKEEFKNMIDSMVIHGIKFNEEEFK